MTAHPTVSRSARAAAFLQVVLGIAYLAIGAMWLANAPPGADPFRPEEPYLTVLENLVVWSALVHVLVLTALHVATPAGPNVFTLAALAFGVAFATVTCGVHFVQLAVLRLTQTSAPAWPSIPLALDLFAWDVLFGLSLLLASAAFRGGTLERVARVLFWAGGAACVAGILGPSTGNLRLQLPAIAGYAVLYPVACAVVVVIFGRRARAFERALLPAGFASTAPASRPAVSASAGGSGAPRAS